MENSKLETAILGAGCFWCVETLFKQLAGVQSVKSGFSGGTIKQPTYKDVYKGTTGHAEVIHITFDPAQISFTEILEVFWKVHDPTTLNRQGADIGPQYRSAIFYTTESQKEIAEILKIALDQSHLFPDPIVTEISPLETFYPAQAMHDDYFNLHKDEAYCKW